MSEKQPKKSAQASDSYINAIFLTLSGGFQDAYTYCCRGKVFANAQTGNIVLMSSCLIRGDWEHTVLHLVPLIAFVSGTYFTEVIRRHFKYMKKLHWRQLVLLVEIPVLFGVGFMPQSLNIFANALVSFVCAMQVQAFRKVGENSYASTMCIGNIRCGTESLCALLHTKDKASLHIALSYLGLIFFFAAGAGIGSIMTDLAGEHAIWQSCILLTISFCIMFIREDADVCHDIYAVCKRICRRKLLKHF